MSLCAAICACTSVLLAGNAGMKLWYEKPATYWEEALAIGNGRIGAMVYGGVDSEVIMLNESTLWSGGPQQSNVNPEAHKYLSKVREALNRNDYAEADRLCRKMQGYFSESYLPLGDLTIKQTTADGSVADYRRELQLDNALCRVSFEKGGVRYTRTAFVSAPDSVMVVRIEADKPGSINFEASLTSKLKYETSCEDQLVAMGGNAPARLDPVYYNKQGRDPVAWEVNGHKGMRWQAVMKVCTDGGKLTVADGVATVKGANSAVILSLIHI